MLRSLIVTALFATTLTVPTATSAAECVDVVNVVGLMYADDIHVLARKFYPEGGVQVVFRRAGQRYTLYHTGKVTEPLCWLSFWVRPEGTSRQADMVTFTDFGLDGTVEFGMTGGGSPPENKHFDQERGVGAEFCREWQDRYDQAIVAALAALMPPAAR